ncbi:MAG: phosphoglycerate kinase [Dehalococcoidia bacterium]
MNRRTLRDLDVRGRRVLLRTDYNVDVVDGLVLDDLRIQASLPTIRALLTQGARVVICSHRGRPKGRPEPGLSNRPLASHLSRLLGIEVQATTDCIGASAEAAVAAMRTGEVLLLENLRFHPGEEANDDAFARQLAALGDLYVNDAFGAIHRAHASIVGLPRYLPAAAGLLVEREVDRLSEVAEHPDHPFALVLGGAKVDDKLPMLERLLPQADVVCLGGAMANVVLAAQGIDIGASLADGAGARAAAERLLAAVEARRDFRLVLPDDVVVARSSAAADRYRTVPASRIPAGWSIVDIGARTAEAFASALAGARTAIWNGPMGIFERPPFDAGTRAVAEMLARLGTRTVVGGGETTAAVRAAGLADRVWHLSTGGGATLELLGGRPLPGLDALPERVPAGTSARGR